MLGVKTHKLEKAPMQGKEALKDKFQRRKKGERIRTQIAIGIATTN